MNLRKARFLILSFLICLISLNLYAHIRSSNDIFKERVEEDSEKPNLFKKEKKLKHKEQQEDPKLASSVGVNSKSTRTVNGRFIAPNSLEPTLDHKFDDSLHHSSN